MNENEKLLPDSALCNCSNCSNRFNCRRCGRVPVDKSRICGVGDSLLHDVEGARRAGIDSIFIANGIHAQALGLKVDQS